VPDPAWLGAGRQWSTDQDGVRLPNARRVANQLRLAVEGLEIEDDLLARLRGFA